MKKVAHNIKKFRELKNYTQKHLADRLAISQSHYQRMESGEVHMEGNMIDKIADILEVERELLYAFDESTIFQGNFQSPIINNNRDVNFYSIDGKLEKLYEDKIKLLEAEIERLKSH